MEALGFRVREDAVLRTLTEDVLKSSDIEGEKLDADQVRSSVARRLGIDIGGLRPADRHVEGVVDMMLDSTQQYDRALTAERLSGWHASLSPAGRARRRHRQDALLGTAARRPVERTSAARDQPAARGVRGKLTTSKWAALTKSSTDTALRDIQQLVERGILERSASGGRSTSYALARDL